MENKYKEGMALGWTNAQAVEYTVHSACLALGLEVRYCVCQGRASHPCSLWFVLEAVWTQQLQRKCQRIGSQEKLIKKTSGPAVLNGKSPLAPATLPSHALLKQLMFKRIQNIAGMYQPQSFCISKQLNNSGFVSVRADFLALHWGEHQKWLERRQ